MEVPEWSYVCRWRSDASGLGEIKAEEAAEQAMHVPSRVLHPSNPVLLILSLFMGIRLLFQVTPS